MRAGVGQKSSSRRAKSRGIVPRPSLSAVHNYVSVLERKCLYKRTAELYFGRSGYGK
jgi:hypothetical protein